MYWTGQPSAIFQTDTVSFNRPFGEQWDHKNFSGFKYEDSLGQFNSREWAWVQWIENGRYTVEYCTDSDLDSIGNQLLTHYKTVLIPSHSEYWTDRMRQNITDYVGGNLQSQNEPGNVAFFGANICYWRVTYADKGRKMIVQKCSEQDLWRNQTSQQTGQKMHEALFIGSEFRPIEQRHAVPQIVKNPNHWIYKNSHLNSVGQVFGSGNVNWEPIASGEIDDTLYGFSPSNVQVLARTDANYDSIVHVYSSVTYYINQVRNSRVFNGASFGWHASLFACGDTVGTMVKNILDHFSGLTWADSIVANLTWSNDLRVFAQTFVRQGLTLSTSGTRTFIVDSAVTLSVNGTLEINGTTTITGQNNKWGELAIRSGGTLRIKSGATLNLNAPLFFALATGANLVIESGGTLNIRTNVSTGNNLTISVPSGAALNVYPPGEIYFGSGTGITANGVLNVAGTSNQHITLGAMSGTTPGSWGSIVLSGTGASQSKISNAIIEYGTEIYVNNVSTPYYYFIVDSVEFNSMINAVRTYSSNGWIMNSKINYPRDHGIVAQNGSTIACYNNILTKSDHSGAAILYTSDSYDYIWNNTIRGFNWGIGSSYGASAYCGHPSNFGDNNTITNCLIGAKVYQYALGMFGYFDEGFDPYYTGNSIDSSSTYDVECYDSSDAYGYGVNWGISGPTYSVYNSSNFYFGCGFCKTQSGGSNQTLSANIRREGEKLKRAKKYEEAVQLFKSTIAKNPQEFSAYTELYQLFNDTTADVILNAFASLSTDAPPVVKFLKSNLYLKMGEIETAKQVNNGLINENPDSKISARAMLNNFYISLYDENDPANAEIILNEVLAKPELLTEIELSLAQHALKVFVPTQLEDRKQLRKQRLDVNGNSPTQFSLSQNYPNPFNPATTISYLITESNNVELKIFDYLGREVITLVNEYKNPGNYSTHFNAGGLASGIYFYKIQAGKNIAVKKMLLLK